MNILYEIFASRTYNPECVPNIESRQRMTAMIRNMFSGSFPDQVLPVKRIPEALLVLKKVHGEVGLEIRMLAAVKLYETGYLSSGAAEKMAGITKVLFLSLLHEYLISNFTFKNEELNREIASLGMGNM